VQTEHTALASHEVATLLPPMEEADYRELVEDIRAHGLIEPIWLYEGQIADGRHRYRACLDAGVEPRFRTWDGPGTLVDFVLSLNVERRHLTPAQRAAIAVEVLPLYEADAKRRQRELAGTRRTAGVTDLGAIVPQPPQDAATPAARAPKASERAAQKMHVSARYVAATKRIKAEAPAVLEEMRRGVLTVPEATKLARMSEQSRAALLERLQTGEAASLRKAQEIVTGEQRKERSAALASAEVQWFPDGSARGDIRKILADLSSRFPPPPPRDSPPPAALITAYLGHNEWLTDDLASTPALPPRLEPTLLPSVSQHLLNHLCLYLIQRPDATWEDIWKGFQAVSDVLHAVQDNRLEPPWRTDMTYPNPFMGLGKMGPHAFCDSEDAYPDGTFSTPQERQRRRAAAVVKLQQGLATLQQERGAPSVDRDAGREAEEKAP